MQRRYLGEARPRRPALATARVWLQLLASAGLLLVVLTTVAAAIDAADRFGTGGGFRHALEYTLLPFSTALLRLAGLVLLVAALAYGLGRGLGRFIGPRLAALPQAAVFGLLAYLGTVYALSSPDLDDLFYGNPDVRWLATSAGGTVVGVLIGAAALLLARWLLTDPTRPRRAWWRTQRIALGVLAAVAVVALALPHLVGAPDNSRRNIVLISMDTLRADHLGTYGYERDTSPRIDTLGRRGTVFERAISQAPWTLPAHMTLFTGLYPGEHGLTEFSLDEAAWRPLAPTVPLLGERLQRRGYVTAAFTGGGFVGPAFGFDRGFDLFRTDSRRLEDFQPAVLRWLGRNRARPFLLFLHFYNTHRPYDPPPPYDELFVDPALRSLAGSQIGFCREAERAGRAPQPAVIDYAISQYDGEIRYADELLGEVLDRLADLGLEDDTLVVFFSDHGEEFFEHGNCDHLKSLYEPLVHIPLIVAGPDLSAGRRIADPVELRDVHRLVLDFVSTGDSPDATTPTTARPLFAWLRDEAPPTSSPAWAETCCKGYRIVDGKWSLAPWKSGVAMLRDQRHKLIADEAGEPIELYDLDADPGEQRNLLIGEPPPVAAELGAELRRRLAAQAASRATVDEGSEPLDAETREQLEALGYVGGGAGS